MLILEFSAAALALTLVYLFSKTYKTKRSLFLLGLPLGFFFLASSYLFLGAHLIDLTFQNVNSISSSLMWVRVVTQTIGFVLIASSYLFAGRYQHTTKQSYLVILSGSAALILIAFGLLFVINPSGLASVYSDNQLFAIANLALLSYIILFLFRKLQLTNRGASALVSGPMAFTFLWLGQFSFLVWVLADGGDIALIGSQVARVISFVIFLRIYYTASKEQSTNALSQKKQS
jgi:hypothetical protein